MDINHLAKELDGIYTIPTIQKKLEVSRETAINYVSLLRKKGYLATKRGARKIRLYNISPIRFRTDGNPGFYEIINKYSNVKLATSHKTVIHGEKLSIEKVIIEAIKRGRYRVIIAVMPLFNQITKWSLLLKLAKENKIQNKVGALYDLTRTVLKTKRMDKRTENSLKRYRKKVYLIDGLTKEKEFADIGKKWNVVIGLRRQDLWRLKE